MAVVMAIGRIRDRHQLGNRLPPLELAVSAGRARCARPIRRPFPAVTGPLSEDEERPREGQGLFGFLLLPLPQSRTLHA